MSFEKNKGGEERERDMGLDEGEREQTLTPFVISNELIGHVCCMRPLSMCHFNVLPPNLVCSNSGKPVCSKSLSSGLYLTMPWLAQIIINKIISQYQFFLVIVQLKKNQHTHKLNILTKTENQNIHKRV